MKPKAVILYVILPAFTILVGMKFYAQYRHIDIYVMRRAPMPAEISNKLHMAEHGIDSTITVETPYASASDKVLPPEEIRKIRSQLVWRTSMSPFIDSLTIQSTNRVIARRTTDRSMTEYQLLKINNAWTIQGTTGTKFQNQ
jgi:hypothetical protein